MMQKTIVNILGTKYTVILASKNEYPYLEKADGFLDSSVHKIIVDDMSKYKGDIDTKEDLDRYRKKVLRHEVLHAFLTESGLDINSNEVGAWATNEEMIDWFAIQFPKIKKVFNELKING